MKKKITMPVMMLVTALMCITMLTACFGGGYSKR